MLSGHQPAVELSAGEPYPNRWAGRSLAARAGECALVSLVVFAGLMLLGPAAPFGRELGVCESGAVRDVLAGNVILPHYAPGQPIQPPPLYWWMAALGTLFFGWSEFALRLPSLLAAALTCGVLFGWVAHSAGRRAGWWAVACLMLCHFFTDAARQPRMDALFALFVTCAAVGLERAVNGIAHRRARWLLLAALAMALATLTKGPIGLILPGLALGLFLLVRKRGSELFDRGLVWCFTGALGVGLCWYLAGYAVGGWQFFQWQVVLGLWRRFIPVSMGAVVQCGRPAYYYVPETLSGFLPWSLYLPALAWWLYRRPRPWPTGTLFALCWMVAVIGFFSISTGKCLVYILPAFPPLAALTGTFIAGLGQGSEKSSEERSAGKRPLVERLFTLGSLAIALGGLAIAFGVVVLAHWSVPAALLAHLHRSDRLTMALLARIGAHAGAGSLALLALTVLGGATVLLSLRALPRQALGAGLIALAGTLFWFGIVTPELAAGESLKSFAPIVEQAVPPGHPIDYMGAVDCDLQFYCASQLKEVSGFGCERDRGAFLILRADQLNGLPAASRACLVELARSEAPDRHGPRLLMRVR